MGPENFYLAPDWLIFGLFCLRPCLHSAWARLWGGGLAWRGVAARQGGVAWGQRSQASLSSLSPTGTSCLQERAGLVRQGAAARPSRPPPRRCGIPRCLVTSSRSWPTATGRHKPGWLAGPTPLPSPGVGSLPTSTPLLPPSPSPSPTSLSFHFPPRSSCIPSLLPSFPPSPAPAS